ncbi:MAG TPA: TraM recognition domain-containing protein [Alphaproteobacteria bacterium]|nr:TraM recognition domain-containing protein [Alphaproteobacteria bacterium]
MRDTRPMLVRFFDSAQEPFVVSFFLTAMAVWIALSGIGAALSDVVLFCGMIYFLLVMRVKPKGNYRTPTYYDKKKGDGILFLGNQKGSNSELWVSNSDARTHILYLGTTGSGKTEGLKSLVANALTWGSGFVYVDGKADTDLWASIYALARRFGRDDDIMVLNYMTGNKDGATVSNTMNPFSYGSASYLTNMMVGLMDEAGGDTAMWKGRAVSLMGALMPALTYMRDNEDLLLDVQVIRDALNFKDLIRLSRSKTMPERIRKGLKGYLDTLPGYVDEAFDDNGDEKPPGPGNPGADMTVPRQQHGYLTMQFTRSLQSLADEYGHIFKTQLADIDMMDVVLNRRLMLVLIPALEKSGDEAANLGKIIAANIKGMMGATLGSEVEGDWESVIENKATRSNSPFMTVFDEVGYYTAAGMAVMAAQARSLGFCLIFAAQDLPALEKRVKEEARSITANCNIKIFGKLEDPTQTREFFENTVGGATISKISSFDKGAGGSGYSEQKGASVSDVKKASYGELKMQKEGEAHIAFMADTLEAKMFYANPKKVKAMRVNRYLRVNPTAVDEVLRDPAVDTLMKAFKNPNFAASRAAPAPANIPEFETLRRGWMLEGEPKDWVRAGALAISNLAYAQGMIKLTAPEKNEEGEDALAIDSLLAEFKANRGQKDEVPTQKQITAPEMAATAPAAPVQPKVNLAKDDDEDEDALDFSSLFGKSSSDGEDRVEVASESVAETAMPPLVLPPLQAETEIQENLRSDIAIKADMTPSTTPIIAPEDLSEELLPPEQEMTSFIEDIMKRSGRALGQSLFGSQQQSE